jgi:hypothetical protein
MKIFDGFEEIEILPWYECQDCTNHSRFPSWSSALLFLQRFRTSEVAMDSLRRLIRGGGDSPTPQISNEHEVFNQVAHMLARGELHLTLKPLDLGTGATEPKKEAPQPRPQPPPESPRRQAVEAPPPPPSEEPVFHPNVDLGAIAQVLTHAARSGVPFCEE